jgi:putative ATP-dependent endonuclease of OLD family
MAKLDSLIIDKYRSINHVELFLPNNAPLVLIGENNAGKSNIVKAIDIILGETWPTSHDPETHEFYLRDPNQPIYIEASFSEPLGRWRTLIWEYSSAYQL